MKVVTILFFLSLVCLAKEAAPVEKKTDFLRVEHSEKIAKLQTAVTIYEKDGAKVSLIGAVHIADQSYYDALNKKFATYDRLLFEMIGGERMGEIQKQGEKPSFLGKTYAAVAGFLKLADQKKAIDYSAKNFIHADLSLTEFKTLQEKRDESLLSFAFNAGQTPKKNKKQPNSFKLLTAMLTGDADKLKLELIEALADGDDQIGAFAGDSVIITDRNTKCLQVLDAQLKAGHKNLGIFYGAAHFPDMEKTLKERGFTIGKQEWLDAWTVKKDD